MFDPVFFPISGIETWWWLPLLISFVVAGACSLAGLSGAFLLLPFQVSVLGYTGLGVSATNHLYNVIATQGGIYRLWRHGRLLWPLAILLIAGTLPGVVLGVWVRLHLLGDLATFKVFVGLVLLLLALNLGKDSFRKMRSHEAYEDSCSDWRVKEQKLSWRGLSFIFNERLYQFSVWGFIALALIVGMVGGIYGIGGGAIITPFIMACYRIPVHALVAAALLTTMATSVFGVLFFVILAYVSQMPVGPDWYLGLLLGAGGFAGLYLGSRVQHLVKEKWLRLFLLAVLLYIAVSYLLPG